MATLTVPSDSNGMLIDQTLVSVVREAIATTPFGFKDVYLYSHGWSTDADRAAIDYDVFSVGLARRVLLEQEARGALAGAPRAALELGVHWPSVITEDPTSALNALQLFTFFSMEQRADAVGKNLVYSLLRLALEGREGQPTRVFIIGHSFGSKVVCAALQDIEADLGSTISVSDQTCWKIVLLEPATDSDNLETGDIYGNVSRISNLRLLITTSQKDECLTTWYPAAGRIANLFHGATPRNALGATGPTDKTRQQFESSSDLTVGLGFDVATAAAVKDRLLVADLTPAHQARSMGDSPQYSGGICGSHSDIFFDELYNLVGGFFYA